MSMTVMLSRPPMRLAASMRAWQADWSAGAYGRVDATTEEAIRLAARREALALDPVYSGKAMAGLIGLARRGRFGADDTIVFIHTGGGPGLFAYPAAIARLSG